MGEFTILIVDDDAEIRELIAMYLQDHRLKTLEAGDGNAALRQFRIHRPELILLDVMMPGMDGYAVCKQIREESAVPILFLTSKWGTEDMVKGLEIGGDDYITKPFTPDVLIARVKSRLRRTAPDPTADVIRFGDLKIHRDTYEVNYRGREIPFLAKETKLFLFLAERPKQVFNTQILYEHVWEYSEGDTRTVMVHISNIRKKLELYAPNTVSIETIKGIGYRLVPAEGNVARTAVPATKEAIIEAASELFSEKGYEGMSMKEIARKVGIPVSSIYSVFKNKEDLFLHIYRKVLNSHLQLAVDYTDSQEQHSVETQLGELLQSVIQFQVKEVSKMKIFIRILLFPSHYFGQNLKEEFIKLENKEYELFKAMFLKGMENGEIKQGDAGRLALLLICMLDGFFWQMQRHDEKTFLERFDVVWEQFWGLIKA